MDKITVPTTFVTQTLPAIDALELPTYLETYDEKIEFLIWFYKEWRPPACKHGEKNGHGGVND